MCNFLRQVVDKDEFVASKRVGDVSLTEMVGSLGKISLMLYQVFLGSCLWQRHARVPDLVAPSGKAEAMNTDCRLSHHLVVVALAQI